MATVADLIGESMEDLGVIADGAVPTASQLTKAFTRLNELVDQWKAERLLIYTVTRTEKAITASDGSYTVGSGGDVNIDRPEFIERVTFMDGNQDPDHETPLGELTEDEYALWAQKAQTADRPTHYYYNPTFASSRGTLNLFPVPTGSGYYFVLYAWTALAEFSATSDTVTLPPAYRRMIVKHLALEIAPQYGRTPSQLLTTQAAKAMAVVKRRNQRFTKAQFSADMLIGGRSYGSYSIRQG